MSYRTVNSNNDNVESSTSEIDFEQDVYVEQGSTYDINIVITDDANKAVMDDVVLVTIYDTRNKLYFNGLLWTETECQISMQHVFNGVYTFSFTPDLESIFEVKVRSENYPFGYVQTIRSMKELGSIPIRISNETFKNQDGTDSLIVDKQGKPLSGVKISCFDMLTKELVGISQTDSNGEWNMMIPAGKYFFTFEKDGYISVSFERSVF